MSLNYLIWINSELAELLWAMDATKKSYQKLIAATDELVKSQFIGPGL